MHSGPREVAIRILCETGDTSRASYFEGLDDPRDRALAKELASGTLQWRGLVDYHLARFSDRTLGSLRPRLLSALRVGVFQLLFTGVPQYAAVNSVVESLRHGGERSFANGVLRSVARSAGHLDLPSVDAEPLKYIATRFSHPEWIAKAYLRRFGLSDSLRLASHNNCPPPLVLRVNLLRATREDYLRLLRAKGYRAEESLTPAGVRVMDGADVTSLPGFRDGLFVVQDEGAGAISAAVGVQAGERVWDVCAAPGGKTTHMAEMMGGTGEVLATDIDPARVDMVRETASRLGLRNVTAAVMDATGDGPKEPGTLFDRILLDAPCSGLGVLRRRADLRWNRRESDVEKMAARQSAMLDSVAPRLRPGGTLVYSTCTLTSEENECVWKDFLRKHPEFLVLDPREGAACEYRRLYAGERFAGPGYRYILPQDWDTDGFFVARAVKRG